MALALIETDPGQRWAAMVSLLLALTNLCLLSHNASCYDSAVVTVNVATVCRNN